MTTPSFPHGWAAPETALQERDLAPINPGPRRATIFYHDGALRVRVGDETVDLVGADMTPAAQAHLAGARGPLPYPDGPGSSPLVLMERTGLWTVGCKVTAPDNPERKSAFYRTRVDISFGSVTGTVAVNDIVTHTDGWIGRVHSINLGGLSAQISLYSGTVTSGGTLTVSPGNTLNAVVVLGTGVGLTTGYDDTSGEKCPSDATAGTSRFNCLGSQQDTAFMTVATNRFPLKPEGYNLTFEFPRGLMTDGASVVFEFEGDVFNDTPDTPQLAVTLQIGDPIYRAADLTDPATPARLGPLLSTPAGAIAAAEHFRARLTLTSRRTVDRDRPALAAFLEFDSPSWSFVDSAVGVFELEDGRDVTNKRSRRHCAVWLASIPDTAASGEFYVNVTSMKATLHRKPKQ